MVFHPSRFPVKKLDSYFGHPKNISETIIFDNSNLKASYGVKFSEVPKCGHQVDTEISFAEVIGGSLTGKYHYNLKQKFNT